MIIRWGVGVAGDKEPVFVVGRQTVARLGGEEAVTVTAQADKKLIAKEKPKRSLWRRLFGGKK